MEVVVRAEGAADGSALHRRGVAGGGNAEEPVYGSSLYKYDLRTGTCQDHQLGDGVRGAEPVFAPASIDAGEDEGWVISLAHDEGSGESRLLIIDAQRFTDPAPVSLPISVIYTLPVPSDMVTPSGYPPTYARVSIPSDIPSSEQEIAHIINDIVIITTPYCFIFTNLLPD